MSHVRRRRGVTLVELMVVLVLLGLMAGVVGLAWRRPSPHDDTDVTAAARQRAIATGATVRVETTTAGRRVTVAALPDGSVIAPAELRIDPLSGKPIHDPR